MGPAREHVRGWLGPRFPVVAALALAVMAVAELATDPSMGGGPALIAVVPGWIGAAFCSLAWRAEVGAVAVAAFYPVGAAFGLTGFTGAGLVAVLVAAGYVGATVGRRRSLATLAGMAGVVATTDLLVHGPG